VGGVARGWGRAMKVLRHTSTHVSAAAKGYAKVASHI